MGKTKRPGKKVVHWRIDANNLDYLETLLANEGVSSIPALVNIIVARYINQFRVK